MLTKQQEKRIATLAKPNNFIAYVTIAPHILEELSAEERQRMTNKLELVQEAAKKLAAGMMKGTIKYNSDDLDLASWIEYFRDEQFDQLNYMMLMKTLLDEAAEHSKLHHIMNK